MLERCLAVMVLALVAPSLSSAKTSTKTFACYGDYANVITVPESGDLLGLELIIKAQDNVEVFMYEGAKVPATATDVKITGNRISLAYNGIKFSGVCRNNGIVYSGYDFKAGKPSNKMILRRK